MRTIKDGTVSIQSEYVTEEIKVPLQNITRLHFRKPTSPLSRETDKVLLSKGEVVSGKLISMDKERIVLESEYASTLNIRKDMVQAIVFASEKGLFLMDDFSEMSDRWKVHSGAWKVKDGKLHQEQSSRCHISVPVEQMGAMTYEWEVAGQQRQLRGAFTFFASNPSNCWGGERLCHLDVRKLSVSVPLPEQQSAANGKHL